MVLSIIAIALRFIAVLLVLVLVHEWGHFFMARRFGVKVHEFGFGFPPRIAKLWHSRGTDFTLNWIPLGGFVRLKGEDGAEAGDADSFASKKAWQRLVILVAGVVMNFVLGYALLVIVFGVGFDMPPQAAGPHALISQQRVEIAGVLSGSPAEKIGLKAGDQIINLGPSAQDVHNYIVSHKDSELELTLLRDGQQVSAHGKPAELSPGVVGLGIQVADLAHVRYGFPYVFAQAARETGHVSTLIFKSLGSLVGNLVKQGQLEQGVSGPIGIAVVTSQVAKTGIIPFLEFVALLSINLGVLNVLPFPALDGGRALFVILEKIVRKKMRMEIERATHLIGFLLLMALVVVVSYRDIIGLLQ